ncbi:MAG: O-antigen polymerase [Comamonadaceae bacterium]|nr:MAG: O-antigen polymerase [Comamonadaceae bacterium]
MRNFLAFSALLLPWLNPFSPGPTAAVIPFLFSWLCAAVCGYALIHASQSNSREQLTSVIAQAWLVAASISSAIGLLQYFGITTWAGHWVNHTSFGEAYGNLRQRNQFATLLNIGLAATLYFAHSQQRDTDIYPTSQVRTSMSVLLPVAILLGIANMASSSRTGLIQMILLVIVTWIWTHKSTPTNAHTPQHKIFMVLLAALSAYAVAAFALPWLAGLDPSSSGALARLRAGDALCSSRLTLWNNVLYLISHKPWTGWGWGELDYAHFITLYPGARFCDILDNAHNLPLHLAVELGIPVAVLACGITIWLVWCARPWHESNPTRQLAWSVLAVIGLHSLLEYPLWYGPFQIASILSIWIVWRSPKEPTAAHKPTNVTQPIIYTSAFIATLVIASCVFAAWNYQLASQIYMAPASRMAMYREDTLEKINKVILFQDQVKFARLTTTELDASNAQEIHDLALDMLHFSPEARVVELILESSRLLGQTNEINFFSQRYQAAFPDAYANWLASQSKK